MTAMPDKPPTHLIIRDIYDRLFRAYGPQHWWPAETPTEVVIGAILAQNTAWANAERAIANLKRADCLSLTALRDLSEQELARLIQPSGTYRVKAARLKAFVDVIWRDHQGSLDALLGGRLPEARRRLLAIRGVGPETADAILLYAAGHATFVVDAYTQRILRRHFVTAPGASYEATRLLFQQHLPRDTVLFNEYHALLVALGKKQCRSRAACSGCPLEDIAHNEQL